MGFCIFNNVAVGANYLIEKYKLQRVAIIDFDVHHGNGTQNIFYSKKKSYIFLHINTLIFLGLVQVMRKDLTIIYLIYPCLQELILMNILMRMNTF